MLYCDLTFCVLQWWVGSLLTHDIVEATDAPFHIRTLSMQANLLLMSRVSPYSIFSKKTPMLMSHVPSHPVPTNSKL